MYLKTVAETEATGRIAELYAGEKARLGFVMSAMQCMTTRPDLLPAYTDFVHRIRDSFSLGMRAWRLITQVAAKQVRSTYCSHVYSRQLIAELGSKEAVLALQKDYRNAGLPAREVEMLAYAEKVARDASQITEADIARLRDAGFSDIQISDIALCAAFRCFVSRFYDAVGAGPEAAFLDDNPEFRAAMNVGRTG